MKIETSPSGRATCRGCKKPIAKGELRFGESYAIPGAGAEGVRYWHLLCAAEKAAGHLKVALDAYSEPIPNRAAIDAAMSGAKGKSAERPFPHVDRAPTGRARCMVCDQPIAKDDYRVVVEREVDTGSFVTKGPGYLHPPCTFAWTQENLECNSAVADWMQSMFGNSGMAQPEIADFTKLLGPK